MGKMVGAGAGPEIIDKLEPEPESKFLTSLSRSRSRTKMDRLRNTGFVGCLNLKTQKKNNSSEISERKTPVLRNENWDRVAVKQEAPGGVEKIP
jgi:hypothetical protein